MFCVYCAARRWFVEERNLIFTLHSHCLSPKRAPTPKTLWGHSFKAKPKWALMTPCKQCVTGDKLSKLLLQVKDLRGSCGLPSLLWLLSLSPSAMSRCRDPVTTQTRVGCWTSVACRRARPTVWKGMCLERRGWGQPVLMGWGWFQQDERKRAVLLLRSHTLVGLWLLVKKGLLGGLYESVVTPLHQSPHLQNWMGHISPPPPLTHTAATHPSFPLSQYVRVRDESAKWEGRGGGPDTNVVHWASRTDLPSSFVKP